MKALFPGLLKAESPFFHLMHAPLDELEARVASWKALPEVTFRVMNGEACKTPEALMRHFADVLQFPDYFSHTWDSLDECLTDLEWLPTRHVVLAMRGAGQILSEEPNAREFLAEILWITGEAWAEASDDQTPMSFHIIFHDEDEEALKAWIPELQAHGALFEQNT